MNKLPISRIITGIGIIVFGIAALLGSINVFNFGDVLHTWWPLLVVVGGLLILLNDRQQYIWALLIIIAGVLWQLSNLELIDFNIWQLFWPVVIIGVGISILTNGASKPSRVASTNTDQLSAVLSGIETKNESSDYKGGKLTAIMGGVSLDLRKAVIKNEATLDVFTLMGGVEIKVPEGWAIRAQATPILGGIENKTMSHEKNNAPTLILVGTVCMGGIEIKH